jgi:hypothetical protein
MKTAGLLLLVGGVFAGVTFAAPVLEVDQAVYDFGERNHLEMVEHDFVLRNVGDEPLVIKRIVPKCGCATGQLESGTIAPGESASLKATLDMSKFKGRIEKMIVVESNDPENPNTTISFSGVARVLVFASPQAVFFNPKNPSETVKREVTILSLDDRPLVLTLTRYDKQRVTAPQLIEKVKGKEYRLLLESLPMKAGTWNDSVELSTNYPEHPLCRVSVVGYLTNQPFSVSRDSIVLKKNRKLPPPLVIKIAPLLAENLKVTRIEVPHESIKAKQFLQGGSILIKLSGLTPMEEINGKPIVIHTNVEGWEKIEIPIFIE